MAENLLHGSPSGRAPTDEKGKNIGEIIQNFNQYAVSVNQSFIFFKDFSSLGSLGSACCKQENCPSTQHLLLCLNLLQVSRGKFAFAAIAVRGYRAFAKDIHASFFIQR